jgi:transposase
LWDWYKQKHPDGYGYTQFTQHYNHWSKSEKGSGKLSHKAGEKVFVDYTGKKMHIVDKDSGEVREVEVFVGILPASQHTFVEASLSQKREDFITSMRHCLEYFGGVPKAIISDNLKSAVSKGCKYEPIINKTFKDFAVHYGCVIDPARPYSATDKAMVEGAIKLVYQRIFYPLSKSTFFSLKELNQAIAERLVIYNDYRFQLTQYSRKEMFVSTEKSLLGPLPADPYQLKRYKRAKVQKMGHIFFSEDKHYYSVPYRFIGKQVEVRYDQSSVEIFYNHERICTHKRDYRAGKYSTIREHMTSAHQQYSEWNLTFFQKKASGIGPATVEYITKVILQYDYPEKGYKQAMGIIHLGRLYQKERIEMSCRKALDAGRHNYRIIENILKNRLEQPDLFDPPANHIPEHKNIRGPQNYY